MNNLLRACAALALFISLAAVASAQVSVSGSLRGRVTDPAGAGIGGATVTLINKGMGTQLVATTDEEGFYDFPRLAPGDYGLTVVREGFARVLREGVRVTVNEAAGVDFALPVGAVTETVTVEADAGVLQTQSVEVSALVNERSTRELPLNGENFQRLVLLPPGVGGNTANNNPSFSGARPSHNTYTVDGVGANDERTPMGFAANTGGFSSDIGLNVPNIISTEAIREFRVITSNADATFGRSSGGQVNIITRSGSNSFNSGVYYYLRNDALEARDFFNTGPFFDEDGRVKVPPFKQHLYGASLGGPLARDRHFFFGNYEGFRQRRREQGRSLTVPNADLISLVPGDLGRFYRTFFVERGLIPATGNPAGAFAPAAATPAAAAPFIAAGFPARLFDGSLANGEAGTVRVSTAPPRDADQNAFTVRTDHQLTGRLSASVRYSFSQSLGVSNFTALPADFLQGSRRYQSGTAQFIYATSPSQILEVRVGASRTKIVQGPQGGVDERLTALGISDEFGVNINPGAPTGLSAVNVQGNQSFVDNQTTPQLSFLHTHSRGRVTLRSGLDLRQVQSNVANVSAATVTYTFTGYVGANGLLGTSAGQSNAVAQSAGAAVFGTNGGPASPMRGYRSTQQEYFTQADWRVRPDLTVNLGLRYTYFGVYGEVGDALSNLYAVDPATREVVPDVSPFAFGRTQNRVERVSDGLPFYRGDSNNFQPRLGFAYDIGGRGTTVLRAGYGLFVDRLYQILFTGAVTNIPYTVASSAANVPFSFGTAVPVNPQFPALTLVDPAIRNPLTHRFNVAVERQLGSDTSVSVAYVGARGRDLFKIEQANGGAGITNQAQRPDPRFSTQSLLTNNAESDYDSLQVFARRRFSRGLEFTAAYTFSESRDNISTEFGSRPSLLNTGATAAAGIQGGGALFVARPRAADYGLSDFDVRHNLTVSHLVEIPVGRGRRFLKNASRLIDTFVGGFELAGVAVLRSGEPFNITRGLDTDDDGDALQDRPALVSGSLRDLLARGGGRTQFLVPQAQALTILNTPTGVSDPLAAIPRNALRAPAVYFYDLSLIKRLRLGEAVTLNLEVNAFNVFNRTNFAAPVSNLSNAAFGQITGTAAGTNPRQLQVGVKLTF